MSIFSDNMRKAREFNEMKIQDVARETGIYAATLSKFESGHITPDIDSALMIAKCLSIQNITSFLTNPNFLEISINNESWKEKIYERYERLSHKEKILVDTIMGL